MIASRTILLLDRLSKDAPVLSLKQLSADLCLSERTLRYELQKIKDLVNTSEHLVVDLHGGTVHLYDKEQLSLFLHQHKTVFSSEERVLIILMQALFTRLINQPQLSKDLYVSKTTIKMDLREVKLFLDAFSLSLDPSHKLGLKLSGDEYQIRQAGMHVMASIKKRDNVLLKEILLQYGRLDEQGITLFISHCQNLTKRILSDEAYFNIKNYLIISVLMIQQGFLLTQAQESHALPAKELEQVKKNSLLLEAHYGIELNEHECLKMADYFLSSHTANITYSYYENWIQTEILVKQLIERFSQFVPEDIATDSTLAEGLLNHIKPALYRLRNNITLEASIVSEVQESYPELFRLTARVLDELYNLHESIFNDDEIAFVTIHFKAAIDRNSISTPEKKQIILVCGLGYGTSKLLAQQIKEYYEVDIIAIIPHHLLTETLRQNKPDLLISTIDLKENDLFYPVIQINPILGYDDFARLDACSLIRRPQKILLSDIMEVLEQYSTIHQPKKLTTALKEILGPALVDNISTKKLTISDMLNKNLIRRASGITDWQQAIACVGELLEKNGCVTAAYTRQMIDTIEEYGSYIVLAPNIAFPHARMDHNVLKSAFAVVELEEKVLFPGNKPVQMLIAFCSHDSQEHTHAFMEMVELANQPDFDLNVLFRFCR